MTTEDHEPRAGSTAGPEATEGWRPATEASAPTGAHASRDPERRRASKALVIGGTLALAAAMTGVAVVNNNDGGGSASSSGEWTNEYGETVAAPAEVTEDYAQVCQDTETGWRLDDAECEAAAAPAQEGTEAGSTTTGGHSHVSWFFIPLQGGRTVPAVGQPLRYGSVQAPAGRAATKVPASGGAFAKAGSVSTGGFGTKGGGAGS